MKLLQRDTKVYCPRAGRDTWGPASQFQVPSVIMYPEYMPYFQVVAPLQSRPWGFFMRLKSNYAEGPSVSKEELTGEEAP